MRTPQQVSATLVGPSAVEAHARLASVCALSLLAMGVLGFAIGGPQDRLGDALGAAMCSAVALLPVAGVRVLGQLPQRWRLHTLRFRLHDAHGAFPDLLWPAHLDGGDLGLQRVTLVWVAGKLLLLKDDGVHVLGLGAQEAGAVEYQPAPNLVRWLFGYGLVVLIAPDRGNVELSLQGAARAARLLRELQAAALAGSSPGLEPAS